MPTFCQNLCEIRKCVMKKDSGTCGSCPDLDNCRTVGAIFANAPEARENLREKSYVN